MADIYNTTSIDINQTIAEVMAATTEITPATASFLQSSFLFSILVSISLSSISLITLFGNLLVIVAVLSTKSLHTITNSFIVSLAAADMLVPVFIEPLSIYMIIFREWKFGPIICDFWIGIDVMLCTASILNLCCISLDRYFAITRPLAYTQLRSPKLARTMIALVWIISFLISCPPVFGWKDERRSTDTCTLNLLLSYRIYSSMGSFFIPCFIMIFVYIRIFIVIHNREKYLKINSSYRSDKSEKSSSHERKRLKQQQLQTLEGSTYLQSTYDIPAAGTKIYFSNNKLQKNELAANEADQKDQTIETRRKSNLMNLRLATQNISIDLESTGTNLNTATSTTKRLRNVSVWSFGTSGKKSKNTKSQEQLRIAKESKAAKKLAIVVGCFILSWLPFFIMYVLESILPVNYFHIDVVNAITWLGYFNSAVNPIIYAFLSNPFRNAFYRLTLGIFKKKPQKNDQFYVTTTRFTKNANKNLFVRK